MKLKNEYQIASTCLFVKSIRQSKQSSFEHVAGYLFVLKLVVTPKGFHQ